MEIKVISKSKFLERLKEKYIARYNTHPKLLKGLAEGFAATYSLIILILPIVVSYKFVSAVILVILFILLYFNQSMYHSSILESHKIKSSVDISQTEANEKEKHGRISFFYLTIMGKTSEAIYTMCHSDSKKTIMKASLSTIEEMLNLLEAELTSLYSMPISASIKIQKGNGKLATLCRGRNCKKSRAVLRKKKLDMNHSWECNTAFVHIMENENDFYSSDDLFSESSFTCEFDENEWKQAFRSTVVMPIRMKLFRSERVKYAVIGLLCVDANLPNPSWKSYEFEDSIGHFHLSAFCSAIYTLLDVRKERVSYVKKRLHDYKQSQMEESV